VVTFRIHVALDTARLVSFVCPPKRTATPEVGLRANPKSLRGPGAFTVETFHHVLLA